ncbi:hypothetical protein RclHR1_08550007 [Rhizophagus clarus]|uniref:Uncharacterized protein n=1 Tax=Rhizophagus clarus TaxID=94130 RepID=A0A2Z6S3I3_9GLOM|nr:hypothetical protein RclHR1_08550007 [Rhizophagus clarus]
MKGPKKSQKNSGQIGIAKKRRDIDIEEANELMSGVRVNKPNVIVEEGVRDKSDEDYDNDDDDDDEGDDNGEEADEIPEQFRKHSKLEIVNWLVKHPDILRLANEMNESSDVAESKNNEVSIESICFVEEYKEIRKSRGTTGNISQKEIKEYVDESVAQKILSRQLVAVNISELINNGGLVTLVDFVREAVRISWNGKNLAAIKALDRMTKELSIPSRSGSNIVNSLSL